MKSFSIYGKLYGKKSRDSGKSRDLRKRGIVSGGDVTALLDPDHAAVAAVKGAECEL